MGVGGGVGRRGRGVDGGWGRVDEGGDLGEGKEGWMGVGGWETVKRGGWGWGGVGRGGRRVDGGGGLKEGEKG